MRELDSSKVILGGTPVDLIDPEPAMELILARAARGGDRPLAVASVNLDHLGAGRTGGWERDESSRSPVGPPS